MFSRIITSLIIALVTFTSVSSLSLAADTTPLGGLVGSPTVSQVSGGSVTQTSGISSQSAGGIERRPGCATPGNCITTIAVSKYEGISTETSFRTAVLKWINFGLGFLTLAATLVVMYAGFMYMLDGGEGEQAGKAKKAILYVLVGIVVMFLSYAFVRTLVQDAPQGIDAMRSDVLHASASADSEIGDPLPPPFYEFNVK